MNAVLELGDLSLQDCFQNAKVPFQSTWRLKGLWLGACGSFLPCKEWASPPLHGAAVWCRQLLLPLGLAWGCCSPLDTDTSGMSHVLEELEVSDGVALQVVPLLSFFCWWWSREGDGYTRSPVYAGALVTHYQNPASNLSYPVTSQGPGIVSIPLPCHEFC